MNSSNKQIFFIKNRISRTETRSTLPGQSVSQNLVSGGDKENGSDQMVQKMHSCALVPPPLLVQRRHCEAFEARCTSHPQSSPNSLSKARIKGFIYERKLNDKDNIFHSFKSELLFLAPRKGLKKVAQTELDRIDKDAESNTGTLGILLALCLPKNTIRDGGSTALYTVDTIDT